MEYGFLLTSVGTLSHPIFHDDIREYPAQAEDMGLDEVTHMHK
jgi:hypothetical protein